MFFHVDDIYRLDLELGWWFLNNASLFISSLNNPPNLSIIYFPNFSFQFYVGIFLFLILLFLPTSSLFFVYFSFVCYSSFLFLHNVCQYYFYGTKLPYDRTLNRINQLSKLTASAAEHNRDIICIREHSYNPNELEIKSHDTSKREREMFVQYRHGKILSMPLKWV